MKSYRSVLLLWMVVIVVVNAAILYGTLNWRFDQQFETYKADAENQRRDQLTELVIDLYKQEKNWDRGQLQLLYSSGLAEGFRVTLWDQAGELIWLNDRTTANQGHMGIMRGRGNGWGNGWTTSIQVDARTLIWNGENIGRMEIGYVPAGMLTESDIAFRANVLRSIVLSVAISILVVVGISVVSSKRVTDPLKKMRLAATALHKGQLDVDIPTGQGTKELHELGETLRYLQESLVEQKALRKAISTNLSHEIRTPLTIMRSHLEAIHDGVWELDADRMGLLQSELDRIHHLAEKIKEVEDLESDTWTVKREEVHVGDFLQDCYKQCLPRFQAAGQVLNVDLGHDLDLVQSFDPSQIKRVLINVLENALRYSSSGMETILSARVTGLEENDLAIKGSNDHELKGQLTIQVADQGMGIDPVDLPHIFERHYRSVSAKGKFAGGDGVGLTIVKTIVEAHGGSLEVKSQLGEGTQIFIRLPLV